MEMQAKLAVLKLAGYEVMKCDRPNTLPQCYWVLFVDGKWETTADKYYWNKFEAVHAAWDHLILNTPKENNVCPK